MAFLLNIHNLKFLSLLRAYSFVIYELRFKTCAPFSYADALFIFSQWLSLCTSSGRGFSSLQKKQCSFSSIRFFQRQGMFQIHLLGFEGLNCMYILNVLLKQRSKTMIFIGNITMQSTFDVVYIVMLSAKYSESIIY